MGLILNNNIIVPGRTFFRAYKTSPQTFTHGSTSIVDYTLETDDPQGAYSNPYYTVPTNGSYYFGSTLFFGLGTNYRRIILMIYRGTTELFRCGDQVYSSSSLPCLNGGGIANLSAGELISTRAYIETTDSGSITSFDNTNNSTNSMLFYGYRIN